MWIHSLLTVAMVFTLMPTPLWGAEIEKLELIRAMPLSGPAGLEPSGLASCNGKLLTVSDKHDTTIYRIQINQTSATAEIAREITLIPTPPTPDLPWIQAIQRWVSSLLYSKYDWEGLACDAANNMFLLSESNLDVLRVPSSGQPEWLNIPIYTSAHQLGLLQNYNAFVEGIALSQASIIIAAEREPRGLMVVSQRGHEWTIERVKRTADTGLPAPTSDQRSSDFSDLYSNGEHLYTLERNHASVCRRHIQSFDVERCWSYSHVENAPDLQYEDSRYGVAEGLTIHKGQLYIVLDNNGDGRKQSPNDHRPILLQFKTPAHWAND